jgi:hypothetical protein
MRGKFAGVAVALMLLRPLKMSDGRNLLKTRVIALGSWHCGLTSERENLR